MKLFVRNLFLVFVSFFLFFIFLFSSKTYAAPTPTPMQESALELPTIKGNAVNPALSASSASDSKILTVPANGTIVYSSALESGIQYLVTISGTFIWGNCDRKNCPNGGPDYKRYGDAGYLTDDHWVSFAHPSWSDSIFLSINNARFRPDAYNSQHIYSLNLTGAGTPISFKINDCSNCYADNSGSLTVEIKQISKIPLILIPGIGGSELKTNETVNWSKDNGHGGIFSHTYPAQEKVWVNNIEAIKPGDDDYFDILRMQSNGQTSEENLGLTGNLFDLYQGTIDFFVSNGYVLNKDFFVFPYDWRKDIALAAPLLDQRINEIKIQTGSAKVDIVAHSMGGLVARNYIADAGRASKVRKLFTLGTPHLGSVDFLKNLRFGGCLTIFEQFEKPICVGISPTELKDVIQNMISGFELAPSQEYFNFYNGQGNYHVYPYQENGQGLSYNQIKSFLTNANHNTSLFNPAEAFHNLDNSLQNTNGVEITNIAGSGRPTLGQIIEKNTKNFLGFTVKEKDSVAINGDETVPLFSASLIDSGRNKSLLGNAKVFYTNQEHGNLVSSGPALHLVKNILDNNSQVPSGVSNQPYSFSGTRVSVHSPVNIHVYDALGNHTGPVVNGDFEANIPGSSYDTLDDAKFIYLPDDGNYDIKFEATDNGSFDFKIREFENNEISQEILYKDIPLTDLTKAETQLNTSSDASPIIQLDKDGNGTTDQNIIASANLTGDEAYDQIPPTTTAILSGTKGNNDWYRSDVKITLQGQDGSSGSGILRTEYSLDNGQTVGIYTKPFVISSEKISKLKFRSIDKAGNEEEPKEIEIKIDRITPEAKIFIDQDKQDLMVMGVDANTTTVIKSDGALVKRKDDAFFLITDIAGNSLKLDVREINITNQDRFRIFSLAYNNTFPFIQELNHFNVIYNEGKKDKSNLLEQNFEVKGDIKIKIRYDKKTNKSTIIPAKKPGTRNSKKEIRDGLVILELLTNRGQIETKY